MTALDDYRAAKDRYFREDEGSPLTPEQRAAFTGLRYYPEHRDLIFEVTPEPVFSGQPIEMQTSTGEVALYHRWVRVEFEVGDEPVTLTIYRDPTFGDLFLPFQDANAGGDTYGAGRYLEVHDIGAGSLLLDFNYAYNPYCAYSDAWSCPIPPSENHLGIPIPAGEMTYEARH